ncbi:MAG: alpha/beta fold hydrolase [Thiohalomonadales bacterium]
MKFLSTVVLATIFLVIGCDQVEPIANKRLIEIDDGKLEYSISGKGQPTVIFLHGGGPEEMDTWKKVYPLIEKHNTVLAYNRFGDGNSDHVAEAQSAQRIIEELRQLLIKTKLTPPYLLVGHSFGGLYANLFARLYPKETMGVVFVDSAHPDQGVLMRNDGSVLGTINSLLQRLYALSNPTKASEFSSFDISVLQIKHAGPFPNIPVIVISAGNKYSVFTSKEDITTIEKLQKQLSLLSPQGKQIVAPDSGHFIQHSEPEIVVNAILSMAHPARR